VRRLATLSATRILLVAGCVLSHVGLAMSTEIPSERSQVEPSGTFERLLTAWNLARNSGDIAAQVVLFRAEDRESVLNAPARGQSNAEIRLRSVQKTSDTSVRILYTRSWGGARPGRVNSTIEAVKRNGEWQLVLPASNVVANEPASPVIETLGPQGVLAEQVSPASTAGSERRALGETQVVRVRPSAAKAAPTFVAAAGAPEMPTKLDVGVGRATLVRLPMQSSRVAVGDPSIADFVVVSPSELYVLGKTLGSTNMLLWDRSGNSFMFDVSVSIDLSPLRSSLAGVVPQESDIKVEAVSGSLVLLGSVSDTPTADTVLTLTESYVRSLNKILQTASAQTDDRNAGNNTPSVASLRVINLLKIRDPQQVMLEVRIAEVSKNLLERLGLKFISLSNTVQREMTLDTITTADPSRLIELNPALGALTYLLSGKKGGLVDIDAQKTDDLVKILAEPTLVAMSGQEGSFLSGGQVYIPVPTVSGSSPTLQQTEFGIRLKFTPTVLDGGRINLQVSPEVSEPVALSGSQTVFSVRKVSSTVQLRDGETLVIGGLMKNNVKEIIKAFPILGELPILGVLFRSSEFQNDRTELVIVVSPTLVKASAQQPPLPTDRFIPPTRSEFFLGGKMEGSGDAERARDVSR